ncbi:hypothetical protein [Streptomyces europaeiscabiei]|nr:hypothetical protein OG858_47970 [Streptomyces europaeiscabiei]
MTGLKFRQNHGDPAKWEDGEYEAYFAWTAPQKPTPTPPASATNDYQPAA